MATVGDQRDRAGGAPVGRPLTSSACGSAPIIGVDVGDGVFVSVTVGSAVAGCGEESLPWVANIAVGTITAIAAATPRPLASRRRRRIEVALPRTSSNASGAPCTPSACWRRVRFSSSSRSLIVPPPALRG